ncbi:SigE family RNA polymerase sigma factor [Oerskovia douganii]|nr:SigE family RNA polymerase sigma factor [Oerskovia douganii]
MALVLPLVGADPFPGPGSTTLGTVPPDDVASDSFDAEFDDHRAAEHPGMLHATRNAEFTAFMARAVAPLHRMAYLLSGDQHRAEELTQQTFERTYRAWSRARDGDPLVYARRILANLRIDSWRRTRREVLAGPEDLQQHAEELVRVPAGRRGGPAPSAVDDRDLVVRALLQLPLKQRRVVVMRHLLDLSEAEVSAELGMPVGTVKSTTSRALARLRAILDDPSTKGGTS